MYKRIFKVRKSETENQVKCSIPIKVFRSTVNLYASRCRVRKVSRSKAKISKYHILENENIGRDICHKILSTDVGLCEEHENINLDDVVPALSPTLESFRNRHSRFNYSDELQSVIRRNEGKKYTRQKYKNQIHVHTMQSFFSWMLYRNVPIELFGTKNLKIIKKTVRHLLKTVPRKQLIKRAFKRNVRTTVAVGASLDMRPLFDKFDISKIKWLCPIDNITKQWIILLKLLHWFFSQYIIKILHKYLVLVSVKGQWVYITKDNWCKMQENFLREKESLCSLKLWTSKELNKSKWNVPIGIYKFIPSSSDLRALLIVKYDIKRKLDDIDIVLRFLQQLYVTFNKNEMPTVSSCKEAVFKFKNSTKSRLCYVRCDIQDAFGSILQEKLYDIICMYCKMLPPYLALRTYTLQKSKRNINQLNKIYKRQTVQFLSHYLNHSISKNAVMNKEKPRLIKRGKLIAKIHKLIFEQKVKLDSKVYSIKLGVPQGTTVSSILSNIYYQHMFKEIFPVYANNGLLCTYVDDILYITENEHYAATFLKTIRNGIPEYNAKFNPSKIQSNVGDCKSRKIKFLGWNITL